jgi:hypothetical protein
MIEAIAEIPCLVLVVAMTLGWGSLGGSILRRVTRAEALAFDLGEIGMLGILVLAVLSMVLNFVLPLTGVVSWGVAGIGVALCVLQRDTLRRALGRRPGRRVAVFLLWAVLIAVYAPLADSSFDVGLYHLQYVMWMKSEPVVLGLANLHTRFGMDPAWLGVLALSWLPGFGIDSVFLMGAVPGLFLALALANHLVDVPNWRRLPMSTAFAVLASLYFIVKVRSGLIGIQTSTDQLPALLVVFCGFVFLRLADRICVQGAHGDADTVRDLALLFALSALGVIAKLTFLPWLALPAVAWLLSRHHRTWRGPLFRLSILALAVGAIWAVRNVLLSGCVVFPASGTCVDALAWTLSRDDIRETFNNITDAPRQSDLSLSGISHWLSIWLRDRSRGATTMLRSILAMGVVSTILAVGLWLLNRTLSSARSENMPREERRLRRALFSTTVAIALAAAVFWLGTASDARLGWGTALVVALIPAMAFLWPVIRTLRSQKVAVAVLLGFVALAGAYPVLSLPHFIRRFEGVAWPRLNTPAIVVRTTIDGTKIWTPTETAQCWLSPLPCTKQGEFDRNLVSGRIGPYLVFRKDRLPSSGTVGLE